MSSLPANKIDSKCTSSNKSSDKQSSSKQPQKDHRTSNNEFERKQLADEDPLQYRRNLDVFIEHRRPQNVKASQNSVTNQRQRYATKPMKAKSRENNDSKFHNSTKVRQFPQYNRQQQKKNEENHQGLRNRNKDWRFFKDRSINKKQFSQNPRKGNDLGSNSTQKTHKQQNEIVNRMEQKQDIRHPKNVRRELVGVIVSDPVFLPDNKQENYVQFLVYNYQIKTFIKLVFIETKSLPNCNLGSWMRLIFSESEFVNLEQNKKYLTPFRAATCQRRVITRILDGHVNFLVLATRQHKKPASDQRIIFYNSRFGVLHLDRKDLMDPISIENEDNDIPHRLRLWCYASKDDFIQEEKLASKELKFNLQRIDERYYMVDANQQKDNLLAEDLLSNDLQNGCNVNEEGDQISQAFSDWFNGVIKDHYQRNCLSEERSQRIREFVDDLLQFLRRELHLPQLNLELFGSVNSGFGSRDCDLDICLVDTGTKAQRNGANRRKILALIGDRLRTNKDFYQITSILDARTPIIKFENMPTGFHGDICVENKLAIYNTKLLKLYSEFDERVPILGSAVKQWAKLFGLHDASIGSISSYAYIVMLIHYLQKTKPPVLPFLQEPLEESNTIINETIEGWEVKFETDIQKVKENQQFCNTESLAQLFIGFFNFYGRKFSPFTDAIQIRTNKEFTKASKNMPTVYKLFVEDPFDLSHNLTAGVCEETLTHIFKCILETGRGLKKIVKNNFPESPLENDSDENCSGSSKAIEQTNFQFIDMEFSKLLSLFKQRRLIQMKKKDKPVNNNNKVNQNKSDNKNLQKEKDDAKEEGLKNMQSKSTASIKNSTQGCPENDNTNKKEKVNGKLVVQNKPVVGRKTSHKQIYRKTVPTNGGNINKKANNPA